MPQSAARCLGLPQYNINIQNKGRRALIFYDFPDVSVTVSNFNLVEPDVLLFSLVIDLNRMFESSDKQPPC